MNIAHLESLINRSIIYLHFTTEEPISLGMYNEGNIRKIASYIDKEGRQIFLIPSESIKGVMRSIASKIFRDMEGGFICEKGNHPDNEANKLSIGIVKKELSCILHEDLINELTEDTIKQFYISLNNCCVCRLFGSNMLASKLVFDDAYFTNTQVLKYASTSIDRKSRIAKENMLFTVESIKPDRVCLKIIADNITKPENRLLSLLLDFISKRGLVLGGLKSRGYGSLSLDRDRTNAKVVEFKINNISEDNKIENINALLLNDNYYKEFGIEEYIKWLQNLA